MRYDIKTGIKKGKTKIAIALSSLLTIGGGAGLSLALFGTASAATPCNVPSVTYPTIQSAVNDPDCDPIAVAPGVYPEHVTVNRSVVLNGANVGVAGNGARGAESIITGDSTGALQITADNVTVDGFQITSPSNALGAGIHMSSTNMGYLIQDNKITGNQIGIYANSNGASTIRNNLFDSNNQPGSSGGAGIYSEFTDHMTIDMNEFKGHIINNPIIFGATGPDVHKNLTVSNNSIHDNLCGCSAVYALSLKDAVFTGNTISSEGSNLRFGGGNNGVTVTMNLLHGGTTGVNVVNDGFGFGLNTGIVVNRNSLTNHTVFGVDNSTSGQASPVDATCNWWGAANGPGPVGTGSGDRVSTNVIFSPWLTTADLNGPCHGANVTNKDQCKNGGWQTLFDNHGNGFKNQGDCVSFVATKGKNPGNG